MKSSHILKCFETITYTTHCDFTYLDNVIPLLERWEAPVSVAIWAPGELFDASISSILFLRNCHPQNFLVRQYASFHIFFEGDQLPKSLCRDYNQLEIDFECPESKPFLNVPHEKAFKAANNLTYPINVGRNLVLEAASTYFVLSSDIELYPNPDLVNNFMEMVQKKPEEVLVKNRWVLILHRLL